MTITRRQFLQFTATAAAATALPTRAQTPLTLWGPPVSPTVLLALAAQNGKAKTIHPFEVKVWRTPDQLRAGLLNGSIQISIVPSYVAANLRNQGQPVILRNIMTRGLLTLLSKNTVITAPEQLANTPLVMPFKNDMPDLVLQILSKRAGITLDGNIHYTAVPPEAVITFLTKDIPHALLPEPIASAALLKGTNIKRGLSIADWWNDSFHTQNGIAQAGLMTSETIAQSHADFLAALDQDLQDAVTPLPQNKTAAAKLVSDYLPAPLAAWETAFDHSALCAIPSHTIAQDILTFFEQLYALNPKIVGNQKPDTRLFG